MDEHTLNDLLECSVCLERLDTTSKVLPCQHTFCRKCLEVIVSSRSELRCPECRVLVDIKIDELPPNVLLMRILEGMKNASNFSQQLPINNPLLDNPVSNPSDQTINSPPHVPTTVNNLALREEHKRLTSNNQENNPRIEQQQQHQQQQQQQQQQHPQVMARRIETSNPVRPTNFIRQPLQSAAFQNANNKQMASSLSTPHAKALYDFESKESGDLSFKKGDKIVLLRRIDINWFVGECNGREGVFPINYVQVLVPLPQPQCKALYDFRMGPNEEEGCLAFKKGAIINVLRRVDQNWAEGRIGDTIGIFPIAFVEMNSLAKYIIDGSAKHMFSTKRIVPATPNEQTPKNNEFSSDSSSTLTTSPNSSTTSNTNSSSSTAPNSPMSSTVSNPACNENRFTLGASNGGNASNQSNQNSNRHSKEIVLQPSNKTKTNNAQKLPTRQSDSTQTNHVTKSNSNKNNSNSSHRLRQNSPSTSLAHSNAFVALYPYKPQKSDELELKKGSIYYVKERCQDGWFRGTNRAQKSGVFPGNYVAPLKNQNADGSVALHANGGGIPNHQKRLHGNNASNNQISSSVPELPPRSSGSSTSVWSKPIGQHVEAIFGRSQSSLIKRITNIKRSKSPVNQSNTSYSMDNPVFEDNTIGCAGNVAATNSTKRNAIHLSHPVHVRSGSCPSQLLQSLPVDINFGSDMNGIITKADLFASQRLKAHKERPTLQAMRQSMEANVRSKNGEPSSSYHRKSQSLDAATISAQIVNCSIDADALNKRKSYTHNEKFKCIVSYPPNSEFELELMVGDIVYVHKKRENGWYKGTHARTGKVGLFPSSFVEPDMTR